MNATAFVLGIPRSEVSRFGYDDDACDLGARPLSECLLFPGGSTLGTLLSSIRPVPSLGGVQLQRQGATAYVSIFEGTPVPASAPIRDMRVFADFGSGPAVEIPTAGHIG